MPVSWTLDEMPDQTGRTAVVTGASSGLGLIAAERLAARGARVIMAVRDPAKGERVRSGLTGDLTVRRLDLADLDSVRAFAAGLRAEGRHLDLLLNNAGTNVGGSGATAQGYEPVFATNHLGHFALTGLLLDLFAPDRLPRVVTVTSGMYRLLRSGPDLDNLAGDPAVSPGVRYVRSKQANVLFGAELDRRLRRAGSPVRSFLAHPGMSRTPLNTRPDGALERVVTNGIGLLTARSPLRATISLLYAATSPTAETGVLHGPSLRKWDSRVHARRIVAPADDPVLAERLWQVSTAATGVAYLDDVPAPAARG
ncbi:SDR family NAD(P)-dependent oxidoreductase [Micromonospora yangpuensis]|uniref:NAD(P)-dependent dehydrogenase, short-chain alcohol dehydrogenase family n=1 Tax=Micromonospora yangpuensis TaxID=683228 RepID=A0A1C6UCI5_9ACTN|nr:SDR family NAD(P)-dependent oxidoreductase [Micromonospora yangpuensis]GGM26422.1 putative short-chain dehydrogenase/reductase [Micromonospora yangpuensis]SCL51805.1 NAD(P)-dependent dehydrogenase, short-chain alcohol dehydrogenase family [Micromonospora yangpuensis]